MTASIKKIQDNTSKRMTKQLKTSTMKISSGLFALFCVSSASAFQVQTPEKLTTSLTASSSYLGGLGSSRVGNDVNMPDMNMPAGTATGPPPGPVNPPPPPRPDVKPVLIEGESLRTWSYPSNRVERVKVVMKTEERPLDAEIELWQGPDNTPQKIRCYCEDGKRRTCCFVVDTPREGNTVCVRNTAHLEFPMLASVETLGPGTSPNIADGVARTIQGGALRTYAFEGEVVSVQVFLQTDGRPLNARIELLQGPNNIKQVMEVYTEDGVDRPFFTLIDTPGVGNVVRVVNTASMEFPIFAMVEAFEIDPDQA